MVAAAFNYTVEEKKAFGNNETDLVMVKDMYNDSTANQPSDTQYQLKFIVKDSKVPVQSATANLSVSRVISNESSNLSGLQPDDKETSYHYLFIVIALNTIILFVGLFLALKICQIARNYRSDRRNGANHMEPLDSSRCQPPTSQCMPSSYIYTGLELTPLSTENNPEGISTFRSPKRCPYCDTNVFSPCTSSEMLQTSTLSAGHHRVSIFYTLKYFLYFDLFFNGVRCNHVKSLCLTCIVIIDRFPLSIISARVLYHKFLQ